MMGFAKEMGHWAYTGLGWGDLRADFLLSRSTLACFDDGRQLDYIRRYKTAFFAVRATV